MTNIKISSLTLKTQKFCQSSIDNFDKNLGENIIVLDVGASTNTKAYRLTVDKDGIATTTTFCNESKTFNLRPEVVQKIFIDIKQLWPFAEPQNKFAVKSRSFGYYAYLTYQGIHSYDLDCYQQSQIQDLVNELKNIARN